MSDIPRVVTPLGNMLMMSDGDYVSNSTHNKNHYVYYEADNSTYISLKDGNTVTPTNDHANWQILCKGMPGASDNNFTDAYKAKVDSAIQPTQANVANGYVGIGADGEINNTKYIANLASNWLKGKTINFLGDSITYGLDPVSGNRLSNPYPQVVGQILNCTTNNYGISGNPISADSNGMCDRCVNMDTSATANVVFGGTNDWVMVRPIGVETDTTKSTIYGALDLLCNNLIATYPNAINVLMTPVKRADGSVNTSYQLSDVVHAIKIVGARYNFPVIDLYENMPNYNPSITALKTKWIPDGIHPNQDCVNKIFAPKVAMSLLNLNNDYVGGFLQQQLTLSLSNLVNSTSLLTKDDNGIVTFAANISVSSLAIGEYHIATIPDKFRPYASAAVGTCIIGAEGNWTVGTAYAAGSNLQIYIPVAITSTSNQIFVNLTYRSK